MWQFFVCYSSVFTALLLQQYFLQQCFYSSILCGITALLKYCITALLCGSDLQQCCTAVYYCIIMFYSIIFTAVFLQQKWYLVLTLTPGSKYSIWVGCCCRKGIKDFNFTPGRKIYHISWYLVYCRNGI